jgi:RNA polymerase sigma-70 factor (ECF subfamily)
LAQEGESLKSCPKTARFGLIMQPAMTPPDLAEEFVFLLARHERLLGAYVMTMVPQPADADDILQEAKVVMWRHFGKFERGTNFGAWARKIAFHQVLAYRKRKHRDRLDFSEDFLRAVSEEVERNGDRLERRATALHECVAKLPPDHREALHLRYHESLSLDDMAARLSRTAGALYRLLSRVRHVLHECVTKSLSRPDHELPA